jgi:hypothetical protein
VHVGVADQHGKHEAPQKVIRAGFPGFRPQPSSS